MEKAVMPCGCIRSVVDLFVGIQTVDSPSHRRYTYYTILYFVLHTYRVISLWHGRLRTTIRLAARSRLDRRMLCRCSALSVFHPSPSHPAYDSPIPPVHIGSTITAALFLQSPFTTSVCPTSRIQNCTSSPTTLTAPSLTFSPVPHYTPQKVVLT
jgi:hypothetical protein